MPSDDGPAAAKVAVIAESLSRRLFGNRSAALGSTVAVRTREIGLRLALGAERRQIRRMILKEALSLSGWGVGLGVAASLVFGRSLSHILYGVQPTDLSSLFGVSLLLIGVSLAAGTLPARRATRIDPIAALHND